MTRFHVFLWSVSALVVLMAVGRYQIGKALGSLHADMEFAREYQDKFVRFINGLFSRQHFDNELYGWLTYNVARMQRDLGDFGKVDYRPPYAGYMVRNYQLLVNTLNQMRSALSDEYGFQLLGKDQDAASCSDMILRYAGSLGEQEQDLLRESGSPFVWLQQGTQFIVTLPIRLLVWSGLIQYSTFASVSQNGVIKFLSFLINLVGFVGSIITIVTGWNPFLTIYHTWHK